MEQGHNWKQSSEKEKNKNLIFSLLTSLYNKPKYKMKKPTEAEIKEAFLDLSSVRKSCEEGYDGDWNCSTDEGKEGFNDMIELLDRAVEIFKKLK